VIEAFAPASLAGIFTASASVLTALAALGGVVLALAKVLPGLRRNAAQLEIIHTLVNSTLTAALQAELDSTRREAMLLRELMSMREDAGQTITDEQRQALSSVRVRISELSQSMSDRVAQTAAAEKQIQAELTRRD
jgi:hypothetical protein